MVEYGMGFRLTQEEKASVKHIMDPIEEGLILTNDYWSWDREYKEWTENGSRLANSVGVIWKLRDVDFDEARNIVKDRIIYLEQTYLRRLTDFYETHPDLPIHIKRWLEASGSVISGSHYWSSSCPRYHSQTPIDSQESSETNCSDEVDRATSLSSLSSTSYCLENESNETLETCRKARKNRSRDMTVKPEKSNNKSFDAGVVKNQSDPEYLWQSSDSTMVDGPCNYISSMPSKGVRSLLIESINIWLHVPKTRIIMIDNIVRTLHNASLILDDIEDNSILRRGKAATHTIFGHAQSINSANYMFVQAAQEARKLSNPQSMEILLQNLACLQIGQSWDIHWRHNLVCPHEKEYISMIDNKTGGMFRMLLRLMQAESDLIPIFDFDHLIVLVGRFFQIRDDYMNLCSSEYSDQKGFCEDLDEGKFCYLIVHCLQNKPEYGAQILSIFRQRPTMLNQPNPSLSREIKLHILGLLRQAGTFADVKEYLVHLEDEIELEIKKLEESTGEPNPMLRLLLAKLSVRDHIEIEAQ